MESVKIIVVLHTVSISYIIQMQQSKTKQLPPHQKALFCMEIEIMWIHNASRN